MFTYRTKKTAPAESPPQFDRSQKNYGFISILHQIVAKAPATYYGLSTSLRYSSITPS